MSKVPAFSIERGDRGSLVPCLRASTILVSIEWLTGAAIRLLRGETGSLFPKPLQSVNRRRHRGVLGLAKGVLHLSRLCSASPRCQCVRTYSTTLPICASTNRASMKVQSPESAFETQLRLWGCAFSMKRIGLDQESSDTAAVMLHICALASENTFWPE